MSTNALPERPITILIAALGGEGGGVLADWIIAAAVSQDYPVQSTSIPGVAQRTGATTYYIELYPVHNAELDGRRPVMTLTPAPSYVDVMLSSELLETGRAMLNGFVTPELTTLIASTHRVYTVNEKIHMGDGRFDSDRILKAAQEMARRTILFDMQELAARCGTVINAVMFGALAGSGVLPLPRAACEEAIRRGGRGAEASLQGFAAGYGHASGETRPASPEESVRWRKEPSERVRSTFPGETHRMLEEGVARVADFQDTAYAGLYLDRLEPIAKLDREQGGGAAIERTGQAGAHGHRLTNETGRFLALWMSYEDLIRVADLKSRRSRFERVRAEVQAKPGEPVHIIEYLKPGVEEVAAMLPTALSKPFLAWAEKRGLTYKLNVGIYLKSTSVLGFLLLRVLASLRRVRRMTARYAEEQALIERWLGAIRTAGKRDLALAIEIALCGRLIKGYGDTHRRAKANFLRIMDTLVDATSFTDDRAREPLDDRAREPLDDRARAVAIAKARDAALADPEGRGLENSLATHGITPLPPQSKPIQFMRRPAQGRKAA